MKASKADLNKALTRFDPALRLVFLHGPDEAASRDLSRKFIAKLAPPDDPMAVVDLPAAMLSQDPGRLADEAASVSMFGGSRVIRIDNVGEDALEAIQLLLAAPAAGNPAVVTAGSLRKGSKLLALVEGSPLALSFVSYEPDARDAESVVIEAAAEFGLKISRPAVRLLIEACGSERGVLRQELDKLALYLDASPEAPRSLEPEHLVAVGAELREADFSALVEAVTSGRAAEAVRQISRLGEQGIAGIAMLRAVLRRLWLLLELRLAVDAGKSPQAVVEAVRPPIFWKEKPIVMAQLQRWRSGALRSAIGHMLATERELKRSGAAGDVLASQALLAITAQAARGGQG